jgi:hypothetical protein
MHIVGALSLFLAAASLLGQPGQCNDAAGRALPAYNGSILADLFGDAGRAALVVRWEREPLVGAASVIGRRMLDASFPLRCCAALEDLLHLAGVAAGGGELSAAVAAGRLTLVRDGYLKTNGRDILDVYVALWKGFTLVINNADQLSQSVANIAGALSAALALDVNANMYISPPPLPANATGVSPEHRGFRPHFDPHDSVVCQLLGAKDWEFWADRSLTLPLEAEKPGWDAVHFPEMQLDHPAHRIRPHPVGGHSTLRLREGECLYVPRGLLHSARAALVEGSTSTAGGATITPPSVHLTFGLLAEGSRRLWGQALQMALEQVDGEGEPLPSELSVMALLGNQECGGASGRRHSRPLRETALVAAAEGAVEDSAEGAAAVAAVEALMHCLGAAAGRLSDRAARPLRRRLAKPELPAAVVLAARTAARAVARSTRAAATEEEGGAVEGGAVPSTLWALLKLREAAAGGTAMGLRLRRRGPAEGGAELGFEDGRGEPAEAGVLRRLQLEAAMLPPPSRSQTPHRRTAGEQHDLRQHHREFHVVRVRWPHWEGNEPAGAAGRIGLADGRTFSIIGLRLAQQLLLLYAAHYNNAAHAAESLHGPWFGAVPRHGGGFSLAELLAPEGGPAEPKRWLPPAVVSPQQRRVARALVSSVLAAAGVDEGPLVLQPAELVEAARMLVIYGVLTL